MIENRILALIFALTFSVHYFCQDFDVLVTESFDNTTNLSTDASFAGDGNGCGFSDNFNVSNNYADPTNATDYVNYEVGSVFYAADIDGTGGGTPTYLDVFSYVVTDNDEIGFVGNFAKPSCATALDAGTDELRIRYSTDGGTTFTNGLTITATGASTLSCSDGTINLSGNFRTKEFTIGSGLMGQTVVIRVEISGFERGDEHFALDEFRLVKTKNVLASENFDNTTNLSTSSGPTTFDTPIESSTCDNNDIYDVSDNMATPTYITNCVNYEDGSVFVLNHRAATSAADGEELTVFNVVAPNNNKISFRGNFTTFGSQTNPDNTVEIQYSTDGGATFTTGLTFTGQSVPNHYLVSDGTEPLPYQDFVTKGFYIGSGLMGQTIIVKVVFNKLDNPDDGIALDKFILEGTPDPSFSLPVELINFDVLGNDSYVKLDWSTASEINNSHFEVQKSSDAENWITMTIVKGAGNSTKTINYYAKDLSPRNGLNYYRLRQVDFNGAYEYSKVQAVKFQDNSFAIIPNVVHTGESIRLTNLKNAEQLNFYQINGKLVMQRMLQNDLDEVLIDQNFSKGFYLVEITDILGSKSVNRLIVE